VSGLQDAIAFINASTQGVADIYMKSEPFVGTSEELLKMMKGETADELSFTPVPNFTKQFTDFMFKSGMLRKAAGSWKDVRFENV
jgi:hypothetical protein